MNALLAAFAKEFAAEWPTDDVFARVTVRLVLAVLLATVIGWEREEHHKTAGLRDHQLVALGSALFVVACCDAFHNSESVTRVVQGIATGIGFIGGGAILKMPDKDRIRGLTTAGSIWCSASVGSAAGLGEMGAATIGLILVFFVLAVLEKLKRRIDNKSPFRAETPVSPG